YDLRHALGAEARRLASDSARTLRLNSSGLFVDALTFDSLVERGDAASLEAAVQLYAGALLEGCADEWVLEDRRVREQAYVSALETLASDAAAHGEHTCAARYLRLSVGVDPYRE